MSEATVIGLKTTVRKAVLAIAHGGPETARAEAEAVRSVLATQGLGPRCHVGRKGMDPDETVEWYAGQLLDIVDAGAWFAMNSFVNALDRFVPEEDL